MSDSDSTQAATPRYATAEQRMTLASDACAQIAGFAGAALAIAHHPENFCEIEKHLAVVGMLTAIKELASDVTILAYPNDDKIELNFMSKVCARMGIADPSAGEARHG
jgi:hypothetical protein